MTSKMIPEFEAKRVWQSKESKREEKGKLELEKERLSGFGKLMWESAQKGFSGSKSSSTSTSSEPVIPSYRTLPCA